MKQKKLKDLNEIKDKYQDLLKKYQPVVMGEGNPDADIALVGEAPGRYEVEKGRPFVGQAGKNLNEFLQVLELKREDLYITNAVKFRPVRKNMKTGSFSNRAPTRKEIKMFRPILMEEIQIVDPHIIVTLGNIPLFSLMGKDFKIGDVHGKPMNFDSRIVFPLYHPASIIYRRGLREIYQEDLKKLKEFLQTTWK